MSDTHRVAPRDTQPAAATPGTPQGTLFAPVDIVDNESGL